MFFVSIAKSTDFFKSAGIEISDIIPPARETIDKNSKNLYLVRYKKNLRMNSNSPFFVLELIISIPPLQDKVVLIFEKKRNNYIFFPIKLFS